MLFKLFNANSNKACTLTGSKVTKVCSGVGTKYKVYKNGKYVGTYIQ